MKLFVVGQSPAHTLAVLAPAGITRLLVSYAIVRPGHVPAWQESFAKAGIADVFLDSGAFSAHTRGVRIELSEYEAVIDALAPQMFAALDVIGDADRTRANLDRMERDGYRPIPVYTRGAPITDLRDLLSRGYTYVAVGNIARAPRRMKQHATMSEVRRCLDSVFAVTGRSVRVHGFGVMRTDLLAEYPFASVDASSSTIATSLGRMFDLDGLTLTQKQVTSARTASQTRVREQASRNPHMTHAAGVDTRSAGAARMQHNLRQIVELERRVTKLWQARGVTWPDEARVA